MTVHEGCREKESPNPTKPKWSATDFLLQLGSGTEPNDIFNSDSSSSLGIGLGINVTPPRFNGGGKRKSPLGNGAPNNLGTTLSSSSSSSTSTTASGTSSAFTPSANDSPHHLHTSPVSTGCGNGTLEHDRRDSDESGTDEGSGPTTESDVKRLKMANGSSVAKGNNHSGTLGTGSSRTNGVVGAPTGDSSHFRIGEGTGKLSTIRQQQRVYPHSWRHHASLFGREGLNGVSTNEGMQRTSSIGPRTAPSSLSSSSSHQQHDEEWKNIHVVSELRRGWFEVEQ